MCLRAFLFFHHLFKSFLILYWLLVFLLVWGSFLCVRDSFSGYEFQITFISLSLWLVVMLYCLSFKKNGFPSHCEAGTALCFMCVISCHRPFSPLRRCCLHLRELGLRQITWHDLPLCSGVGIRAHFQLTEKGTFLISWSGLFPAVALLFFFRAVLPSSAHARLSVLTLPLTSEAVC